MLRAAGGQQLDQCEALEGVDRSDDQNVQRGGHDLRPLDLPECLQFGGAVNLRSLHKGLVHIAEGRDIQHDGLADRGREQDQDDAAQRIAGITQPVDVLVEEAHRLAQIVEDAVVVVEHPFPHDRNGDRAGDNGQVEDDAEQRGCPRGHVDDGGGHPQREDAGDRHRHDNNDEGVSQCAQKHLVAEKLHIVSQTDKDIGTVHRRVEEAGEHAHEHEVDDEADEEDQAGQQEQITGDGLLPDKRTAHLGLALFGSCRKCQEDLSFPFFIKSGVPPLRFMSEVGRRRMAADLTIYSLVQDALAAALAVVQNSVTAVVTSSSAPTCCSMFHQAVRASAQPGVT